MSDDLDKDASGNVILNPVLGWTTAPVAGMAVLLRIQYAETEDELKTGGKAIQFALGAPQALELAEILTRQANRALASPPPQDRAN